jgi:hypothetical protein
MSLVDFSLGDVGGIFKDIREAVTGEAIVDPMKLAEIEANLVKLEHQANMGQIEINKQEAKHPSIFVAGWRPFIGWVGGFALAYSFIGHPLIEWYVAVQNIKDITIPVIETGVLMNLVMAMLGFGGLRTFEKSRGFDTKKVSKKG